jgi:hypothetical protein
MISAQGRRQSACHAKTRQVKGDLVSSSNSSSFAARRRPSRARVREIEFGHRPAGDPASSGFARYEGPVGVLAVALGVGSAVLV